MPDGITQEVDLDEVRESQCGPELCGIGFEAVPGGQPDRRGHPVSADDQRLGLRGGCCGVTDDGAVEAAYDLLLWFPAVVTNALDLGADHAVVGRVVRPGGGGALRADRRR